MLTALFVQQAASPRADHRPFVAVLAEPDTRLAQELRRPGVHDARRIAESWRLRLLQGKYGPVLIDPRLLGGSQSEATAQAMDRLGTLPSLPDRVSVADDPGVVRGLLDSAPMKGGGFAAWALSQPGFAIHLEPNVVVDFVRGDKKGPSYSIRPADEKEPPTVQFLPRPQAADHPTGDKALPGVASTGAGISLYFEPEEIPLDQVAHGEEALKVLRKEQQSLEDRCAKAADRLFDRVVREGSPFGRWDGRTPTNLAGLSPETAAEISRYFSGNYAALGFASADEALAFVGSASIVPRYGSITASVRLRPAEGPPTVFIWDNPTAFP